MTFEFSIITNHSISHRFQQNVIANVVPVVQNCICDRNCKFRQISFLPLLWNVRLFPAVVSPVYQDALTAHRPGNLRQSLLFRTHQEETRRFELAFTENKCQQKENLIQVEKDYSNSKGNRNAYMNKNQVVKVSPGGPFAPLATSPPRFYLAPKKWVDLTLL